MEKIIHHVTVEQRLHLLSLIPKEGLPKLYRDEFPNIDPRDNVTNYEKWHHIKIDQNGLIVGVSALAYIIGGDIICDWQVVSFDEFCKEIERFKAL